VRSADVLLAHRISTSEIKMRSSTSATLGDLGKPSAAQSLKKNYQGELLCTLCDSQHRPTNC
jgi:hypothetical protein